MLVSSLVDSMAGKMLQMANTARNTGPETGLDYLVQVQSTLQQQVFCIYLLIYLFSTKNHNTLTASPTEKNKQPRIDKTLTLR